MDVKRNILSVVLATFIAVSLSVSAGAVTYWVSPDGDDANSGLDSTAAWATPDNGELLGVIAAGDTVNVLGGTYTPSAKYQLNSSGAAGAPVVYRVFDVGQVVIDGSGFSDHAIEISNNYIEVEGFEISNGTKNGIYLSGDNCRVSACYIRDVLQRGIQCNGTGNLLYRNVIVRTGYEAIKVGDEYNNSYHNTIVSAGGHGIHYEGGEEESRVDNGRIFNNIIVNANEGIRAEGTIVAGFNDLWANRSSDYTSGVYDSAGGIFADPLFVDTLAGDFRLQAGSPCIDTAMDIGYSFEGSAPDMGAIEFVPPNSAPVWSAVSDTTVDENTTLEIEVTATDPDGSIPSLAAENLPSNATFTDKGDGVGKFVFSPDYTQAGSYPVRLIASDGSLADTVSFTVTVVNINREPVLDAIGTQTVEEGQNLNFAVTASDPDGTTPSITAEGLALGATFVDNGDGTGTFDFTPAYDASDYDFDVTFIASDGSGSDSMVVTIEILPAPIAYIEVTPDSASVEALNLYQFTAKGYDAGAQFVADLTDSVVWETDDSSGSISSGGVYTAGSDISPPTYHVWATYDGTFADTSVVTVLAGTETSSIKIEWPDGRGVDDTTLSTDNDSATVYCRRYNSSDSLLGTVAASWSIIGDSMGVVDSIFGLATTLDLRRIGTGRIVARISGTIADTSGLITVVAGEAVNLAVVPDGAAVEKGDSTQFSVQAYDADGNATSAGDISWSVLGRVGSVDSSGWFRADRAGYAQVVAASSTYGMADTSGLVQVEAVEVGTVAQGSLTGRPGDERIVLLTLTLQNFYATDKSVQSVDFRPVVSSVHGASDLLHDVEEIALYLDGDADSLLSAGDSLLAIASTAATVGFSLDPLVLPAGSTRVVFAAAQIAMTGRDGDVLDGYLYPQSDIVMTDSTVLAGPDSANSLGAVALDGMVRDQVIVVAAADSVIESPDSIYNVFAVDVPRNGYSSDTLTALTVVNGGTADEQDLQSLYLAGDDGDGVWEGVSQENLIGEFSFTGNRWTLSGLSVPLSGAKTRFFVASQSAQYPTNGATVNLAIPVGGIEVRSGNDGPLDAAVVTDDTILIVSSEVVQLSSVQVSGKTLRPGEFSGAMLGVEITNSYVSAVGLESLDLTIEAVDPDGAGSVELLSQIDSLAIYINRDNSIEDFSDNDSLLAVVPVDAGKVTATIGGLPIAQEGGTVTLAAGLYVNADQAKDGNSLGITISGAVDAVFDQAVTVEGVFPLVNSTDHIIDIFPAASVVFKPLAGGTFFGGQSDQVVMDFVLPSNGYAADVLTRLEVETDGTLENEGSLLTLRLWADAGNDGLSADDEDLGVFDYDGYRWVIDMIGAGVAPGGQRFIVTLDVKQTSFNGGSVSLHIPVGGGEYESGVTGPDDVAAESGTEFLIVPSNRITAISIPQSSRTIVPGQADNEIFTFALYNGYVGEDKTLRSITLTNASISQSGLDYADAELGQVSLYYDSDNSHTLNGDVLAATGYFSGGSLLMSGLDFVLPAESLSYFYVVADVRADVIDGDSLAVVISSPSDFTFDEALSINGDMPVNSGGYLVVDGSIASQYEVVGVTPRTLSPGDTSVALFGFRPAQNGDQPDVLTKVTIGNQEDATGTDLTEMELWLDIDGDEVYSGSDSLLELLTYSGGVWTGNGLSVPVETSPPVLFVVGDIAATASADVVFRGMLPIDGCEFVSDNDGPRDAPVISDDGFTISSSALQVVYAPVEATYSVGQQVAVAATVKNIGSSSLTSVTVRVAEIVDSTLVIFDSSVSGAESLAPGESSNYVYYYTAGAVGSVYWRLQAQADGDTSATVKTNTTTIQQVPSAVDVRLINSIPTAVTRGQENVYPMSLAFTHPDQGVSAASIRMDSLLLTVEDGSGNALPANQAFSRIVLATGNANLAAVEPVGSATTLSIVFSEALIIAPGTERRISFLIDIDSAAAAKSFGLAVLGGWALPLVDDNSSEGVPFTGETSFPMRTPSCRIDDPSFYLAVGYDPVPVTAVNLGQREAEVLQLRLRHPGHSGSSQIQLTEVTVEFFGSDGLPTAYAGLVDDVVLKRQSATVAQPAEFAADSSRMVLTLFSPLTLAPGDEDSLRLAITMGSSASDSSFKLRVSDSTAFVVRDLSSGSQLAAVTDTLGLATGATVFPMETNPISVLSPATALTMCPQSVLPVSVSGGVDSLEMIDITVTYPVAADVSPVRLFSVAVSVVDSAGSPLNPVWLFDRIGYRVDGYTGYQDFVKLVFGAAVFEFSDTGLLVSPGDSVTVTLLADIEADAPYEHFLLQVMSGQSFEIVDATDTTATPGLQTSVGCSESLPFVSGLTEVYLPAGRPMVSVQSLPVQVTYPGQTDVGVFSGLLTYGSAVPQGSLSLLGLTGRVYQRGPEGSLAVDASVVFERVVVEIAGVEAGRVEAPVGDSVTIGFVSPVTVAHSAELGMQMFCDLKPGVLRGNYFVEFGDSTFLEIEDQNLASAVYPTLAGGNFPVYTAELSVSAAGLEESFANYPNPFNPHVDGATTITYVLTEAAKVDIEIFSITGALVKAVVIDGTRGAGTHQEDVWAGANDVGRMVIPGTYFCRITARYVSGHEETVRRKIAVVR